MNEIQRVSLAVIREGDTSKNIVYYDVLRADKCTRAFLNFSNLQKESPGGLLPFPSRTAIVHDGKVFEKEKVLIQGNACSPHFHPGIVFQHSGGLFHVL